MLPPPFPLLAPPHPHNKALDKTIAINIASPCRIPDPQSGTG
jgi:hypothetical protein